MYGERHGKSSARNDQVRIKEVNESEPLGEMSKNQPLQHRNWGDGRLTRMSSQTQKENFYSLVQLPKPRREDEIFIDQRQIENCQILKQIHAKNIFSY
jgi:hypothetical protein